MKNEIKFEDYIDLEFLSFEIDTNTIIESNRDLKTLTIDFHVPFYSYKSFFKFLLDCNDKEIKELELFYSFLNNLFFTFNKYALSYHYSLLKNFKGKKAKPFENTAFFDSFFAYKDYMININDSNPFDFFLSFFYFRTLREIENCDQQENIMQCNNELKPVKIRDIILQTPLRDSSTVGFFFNNSFSEDFFNDFYKNLYKKHFLGYIADNKLKDQYFSFKCSIVLDHEDFLLNSFFVKRKDKRFFKRNFIFDFSTEVVLNELLALRNFFISNKQKIFNEINDLIKEIQLFLFFHKANQKNSFVYVLKNFNENIFSYNCVNKKDKKVLTNKIFAKNLKKSYSKKDFEFFNYYIHLLFSDIKNDFVKKIR